jgi:predicted PurR-regulated permease PerM
MSQINKSVSANSIYDTSIRLILILAIIVWCLMIMFPFVNIILWSFILAIALHSLHSRLAKRLGERPKLASFIIVLSLLLVFIIPTWLLVSSLIEEIRELKVSYDSGTLRFPPPDERVKSLPVIGEQVFNTWQSASVNLENTILKHKDQLIEIGKKLADGIVSAAGGVVQIVVSLLIAGVLLAIGGVSEAVRKFLRKLAGDSGDDFGDITVQTIRSVANGVIGEAFIIALMNGILFLLAGVPYAGLWALIVFVLAVLQMPVFFVTVPVMIYFFAEKETVSAILWTISLLLVSFSDNILTPLMLGKNAPVPMIVIFMGVIGGVMLSGFVGLFTGAIVMSLGYKMLTGWVNSNDSETQ